MIGVISSKDVAGNCPKCGSDEHTDIVNGELVCDVCDNYELYDADTLEAGRLYVETVSEYLKNIENE